MWATHVQGNINIGIVVFFGGILSYSYILLEKRWGFYSRMGYSKQRYSKNFESLKQATIIYKDFLQRLFYSTDYYKLPIMNHLGVDWHHLALRQRNANFPPPASCAQVAPQWLLACGNAPMRFLRRNIHAGMMFETL